MEKPYAFVSRILVWGFVFSVLYLASRYSYLLFHSLAEIFSIVIACSIFIVAWNTRSFSENNYFLIVGVAYLAVGSLDLLHTLGYKGMGIFHRSDANLPTQLWIAARYLESTTLLAAPAFIHRKSDAFMVLAIFATLTTAIGTAIFGGLFPDCYLEETGLTPFKIISEYVISLLLCGAIAVMLRYRAEFEKSTFRLVIASLATTIGAELAFTFYISVYGLSNLVGHFLKMLSFYFIYKAIIENGLRKPYELLFRNLKQREAELMDEQDQLKAALTQVKTLRGLIPICSHCKKIRDDQGYWKKIEHYISTHSEAEFSHSICPECAQKLYPDLSLSDSKTFL